MIAVKASPEIGRRHGETVCVAGLRIDDNGPPEWMRLFPVPFEWFKGREHPKGQVIEINVVRHNNDQRPESHRPDLASTVVIEQWTPVKRQPLYNALPNVTMCGLLDQSGWNRQSLALVIPAEVSDVTVEDRSASAAQDAKDLRAAQGSLLDNHQIEFSPFIFRFRYRCLHANCNGHHQTIVDWELSEAWRNWRHDYPTDYVQRIQEKWMSLVAPERQPGLLVGNQKQAPAGFLVLGIASGVTPKPPQAPASHGGVLPQQPTGDTDTPQPQSTELRLFD